MNYSHVLDIMSRDIEGLSVAVLVSHSGYFVRKKKNFSALPLSIP